MTKKKPVPQEPLVVDYDEVLRAALTTPAVEGGQTLAVGLGAVSRLGSLVGALVPGVPLAALIFPLLVEAVRNRPASPTGPNEDHRDSIIRMIEAGRRQGLEELEIVVSKRNGDKMGISAGSTIKGLPLKASASVEHTRDGDYKIHVRYGAPGHPQDIEALERYHNLMKQGIITPAEYKAKKRKILGE